jgi:hypothetical protein
MESNQKDTCNISSNALNSLCFDVETSLTSASNYYIGVDPITSPGTYDYYQSTPNIVSVPGSGIIYNSAPISFDLSSIDFSCTIYGDCFRLRSNRKRLKLEFCL